MIFTKRFWKAAAERAVRGGAIAATIHLGGNALVPTATLHWWEAFPAFAAGMVVSVLFSLIGSTSGDGGPSFTGTETLPHEPGTVHDDVVPAGD